MLSSKCIAVANHLVKETLKYNKHKRYYSERIIMTCKRLQKLLYFCEIEYMKYNKGKSLFDDEFYAWPTGPVIYSVYDIFVMYQNGEMYPVEDGKHGSLNRDEIEILDYVFEKTAEIDTRDLVELSQVGTGPWAKAYDEDDVNHQQVISKIDMFKFYHNRKIF